MSTARVRARVFGGSLLELDGEPVRPPSGTVEALLAWFLLRPNEVHAPSELVRVLWGDGHDDRLRQRLYVAISRLRAFLVEVGADAGGLRLVTGDGGYRLEAGVDVHDRLAFDALAGRALAGDAEAARQALALAGGLPYRPVPAWPERARARADVLALRDRVAAVAGAGSSLADQLARGRFLRPSGSAVVPRPRLLPRPRAGTVRLVVVTAPAGFGKSVFLDEWADAQPGPTAWLELDRGDDDPRQLWDDVLTALTVAGVVPAEVRPAGVVPGSPRFREAVARALAAEGPPLGLVLDDGHQVGPATWATELPRLLALAPGRLALAIGTRRPLEVAAAAPDQPGVCHLTADDLRLDADEALSVVRLSDPTAEPGDVAALARVAAGWPIVVSYLGRAGTRPDAADRTLRPLHEYVVDEVLEHAPSAVRDLLIGTAALDRLHPELCDAVTGRDDAGTHLDWLRDQALVLDVRRGGDGWARRHPLVTRPLRDRAARDPDADLGEQHRRAARWFQERALPEEALRHALAGDARDVVAATAGEVIWSAMGRGQIQTCRRWLEQLDPEALIGNRADHDVVMLVVQGWAEPERAAAWVASRRRHYGPDDDLMVMHVEAHRHYLEGRPRRARQIEARAAEIVDDYFDRHPHRPGMRELVTSVLDVVGTCDDILAGELHHDDPRVAAMATQVEDRPLVAVWVLGELAFLAWAEGDADLAADLVDQAAPHLRSLDEASAHYGACRLLAATALVDSDRTADRLQQRRIGRRLAPMVPLFRALRWDVELVPVLLGLHVTALRAGALEDAGRWLAEADVLLGLCEDVPLLDAARARVAQARWSGGADLDREATLTPQEQAVLDRLRTGATYAEVAEALGTSHHTVRSQAAAVYRKLGVRNRKGLGPAPLP